MKIFQIILDFFRNFIYLPKLHFFEKRLVLFKKSSFFSDKASFERSLLIFFACLFLSLPLLSDETSKNKITCLNPTKTLTISSASAGYPLEPCLDTSSVYTIQCDTPKVIKGSLSANLPSCVSLRIKLETPPEGISEGWIELTTTPQTLATNIKSPEGSTHKILCELSAGVEADTATGVMQIVLFLE